MMMMKVLITGLVIAWLQGLPRAMNSSYLSSINGCPVATNHPIANDQYISRSSESLETEISPDS